MCSTKKWVTPSRSLSGMIVYATVLQWHSDVLWVAVCPKQAAQDGDNRLRDHPHPLPVHFEATDSSSAFRLLLDPFSAHPDSPGWPRANDVRTRVAALRGKVIETVYRRGQRLGVTTAGSIPGGSWSTDQPFSGVSTFLLSRSGSRTYLSDPAQGGNGLAGEACMLAVLHWRPPALKADWRSQVQPAHGPGRSRAGVLREITWHDGHMIGYHNLGINTHSTTGASIQVLIVACARSTAI